MERLMILAALATCTVVGLAVLISMMRARRPGLRLDSEVEDDDAHLMIADVAPPRSPIDRRAQVIDVVVDVVPASPRRPDRSAGVEPGPRSPREPAA